ATNLLIQLFNRQMPLNINLFPSHKLNYNDHSIKTFAQHYITLQIIVARTWEVIFRKVSSRELLLHVHGITVNLTLQMAM
ncbi:MAG: hypothetical protein PQ967_04120, partial [Methanobacterium sp.]